MNTFQKHETCTCLQLALLKSETQIRSVKSVTIQYKRKKNNVNFYKVNSISNCQIFILKVFLSTNVSYKMKEIEIQDKIYFITKF